MEKIYIVLSRSNTLVARIIRLLTKKYYNHASVSMDKSLDTFYSFGRHDPRFMFPAGFIVEGVHKGFFGLHPSTKILVLEREVPSEAKEEVMANIRGFVSERKKFRYGIHQLPMVYRGKTYRSEKYYVCSVFCAYILRNAFDFGKDYSLVMPEDFYGLSARMIYEGKREGYVYA